MTCTHRPSLKITTKFAATWEHTITKMTQYTLVWQVNLTSYQWMVQHICSYCMNIIYIYILVEKLIDDMDESVVRDFQNQIAYLSKHGVHPIFNIIDDFSPSKSVKTNLEQKDMKFQMVEIHNH